MAVLPIIRMGHPTLRRAADPVPDPTAPEVRRLAADMIDTVLAADGVGLAAPQVDRSVRVIVLDIPAERLREEDGEPAEAQGPEVLVNPVLEPLDGPERGAVGWEACLSIPGLVGAVPRWERLRFAGVDLDGREIVGEAHGFHARVLQHEVDHLDGILYPQRMTDLSLLMFADELERQAEAESVEGDI